MPSAPSTTAVGVLAGGREDRVDERLVAAGVVLLDPAEVAGLRRGGRVGRDDLGDVVPGLAGLEVREGRVGLGLGGGLLGLGRRGRAGVGRGGDLDDPGVAGLGRGRLRHQPGVDVGGGGGDPCLGRELRLELRVDEPLEGVRR